MENGLGEMVDTYPAITIVYQILEGLFYFSTLYPSLVTFEQFFVGIHFTMNSWEFKQTSPSHSALASSYSFLLKCLRIPSLDDNIPYTIHL